jgi:hypothetical protein
MAIWKLCTFEVVDYGRKYLNIQTMIAYITLIWAINIKSATDRRPYNAARADKHLQRIC